jgi:hypothetical protein
MTLLATLNGNGELHTSDWGYYGLCNVPNCTFATEHSPSRRTIQLRVRKHLELVGDPVRWVAIPTETC